MRGGVPRGDPNSACKLRPFGEQHGQGPRRRRSSAAAIAFAGAVMGSGVVNWHGSDWLATAVEADETAADDDPFATTVDVQNAGGSTMNSWSGPGRPVATGLGGPPRSLCT